MKKAGLAPQSMLTKKTTEPLTLGDLPAEEILAPDGPTALISYRQEGLVRLHTLAEIRRRRIQLVTFGDTPRTLGGEIPVDTVLMPVKRMGEAAVEMLFQKISRPDQPLPTVAVAYEGVASFPASLQHDGDRAAARSLSICAVPEPSSVHLRISDVLARNSQAMAPAKLDHPLDAAGAYGQRIFTPAIRHDATPAAPVSATAPEAAPPAREPAGPR